MELLSLISFFTLNAWMVIAIFLCFTFLLFRGVPVAYALVGVALIFAVIAAFCARPVQGPDQRLYRL